MGERRCWEKEAECLIVSRWPGRGLGGGQGAGRGSEGEVSGRGSEGEAVGRGEQRRQHGSREAGREGHDRGGEKTAGNGHP